MATTLSRETQTKETDEITWQNLNVNFVKYRSASDFSYLLVFMSLNKIYQKVADGFWRNVGYGSCLGQEQIYLNFMVIRIWIRIWWCHIRILLFFSGLAESIIIVETSSYSHSASGSYGNGGGLFSRIVRVKHWDNKNQTFYGFWVMHPHWLCPFQITVSLDLWIEDVEWNRQIQMAATPVRR